MFDRFNYLHCETYLLLHFYLNSFLFNYGNYTPAFTRNIKLSYSKNLSFQHIEQYIPWWETPSNKTQQLLILARESQLDCLYQTGRESMKETGSDDHGVNPPDLGCLRLDLRPPALILWIRLWHQRSCWRQAGRNESSTCCRRNVMVQTVRSYTPWGAQECGHLWNSL